MIIMITLPIMMMMMMMVMMKKKLKKNNLMHTKNPKYKTVHYNALWIAMASKCLALEFLNTYHMAQYVGYPGIYFFLIYP